MQNENTAGRKGISLILLDWWNCIISQCVGAGLYGK